MAAGAWIVLAVAGMMETGWAMGLKYTAGFTRVAFSIITVLFIIGSFFFLSRALIELPIRTDYAAWTGIGIIGTVILGILLFGGSKEFLRILCIVLILAGGAGLWVVTPR